MRRLVILGLVLVAPIARAASPVGEVKVDCAWVQGWAQDPDEPGAIIDVHLYFDGPAGDPAATSIAVTANMPLEAGCAGDQCAHGFRAALPLGRFDGQPHPVHAYGIDVEDPNVELSLSPASYTCSPPPLVAGVKRHIVDPDILGAWKFSIFFDMLRVADLELAAVPVGAPIDAPPQLAVAEGTTDPLWLVDQGFRRAVAPEVLSAWRLEPAGAAPMPADVLAALPVGTPLGLRPVLAQGTGPAVYLLDVRQCLPDDPDPACAGPVEATTGGDESGGEASTGEAGDDTGLTGGSSGGAVPTGGADTTGVGTSTGAAAETTGEAGCGCRGASPGGGWLVLALVLRRRRAARV